MRARNLLTTKHGEIVRQKQPLSVTQAKPQVGCKECGHGGVIGRHNDSKR
jgi:hypothetical protein